MSEKALTSLETACQFSIYLNKILTHTPALRENLLNTYHQRLQPDNFIQFTDWNKLDEQALKAQLRKLRQLVFAHIMVRDLNHDASLAEVTDTISSFADFTINTALEHAQNHYEQRYGTPLNDKEQKQSLTVIAMGKLGGFELNVSSDIDLIFTYPEAGFTNGNKQISNQEFFTKIGQKIIQILDDITEDGQVFRVDMRLRPNGDSGALVVSENALEQYLITQGREWERYAWIKARVVTQEANGIQNLIRPFVYRKYLDFNAYEAMRSLHRQIKQEVIRTNKTNNIKLGAGGIREAEFVTQIFQLIWGGKNHSLQLKGTQETITELARLQFMTETEKNDLLAAYQFLRNVEHRLQYIEDKQTQTLPSDQMAQERIAHSMGFSQYSQFFEALSVHQQKIIQAFDSVFAPSITEKAEHKLASIWQYCLEDEETTKVALANLGFPTENTWQQLVTQKQSVRYKNLTNHAQTLFDNIIPLLLEATSKTTNPALALNRFLEFLETISRRTAYLALLCEHPETLTPLSDIFSASHWVSTYLMRHPILLDELLNARILTEKPDWPALANQLQVQLNNSPDNDAEIKMDILRHFQHAQVFRLAIQDLANAWSVESLSDQLSFLADTTIETTFKQVWHGLKNRHCETPKLAIIGYGKLGGKELGYASDLDLVYLYQDNNHDAVETYSRFMRRFNTWISGSTGAGDLYQIDLRLRPNGEAGLLVSSFEAFSDYQKKQAWVWEHQALTRARFICGDPEIGIQFNALREEILTIPRDPNFLRSEIIHMRERIQQTHPASPENVKYARGGIVDIEFVVQYLILQYAGQYPDLLHNYGNIALLSIAANNGLINTEVAEACRLAYRYYRQIQHQSNLRDKTIKKADDCLMNHYQSVKSLWSQIFLQEI